MHIFMYYVYSLRCKDGYYTGCSSDLKERLKKHKDGYVPVTVKRLPIELDFYIGFNDKHKAFAFEKYLKTGSGRAFAKKHF